MSAATRGSLIALVVTALLPLPTGVWALVYEGDPNDAISCVEDLGVQGFSVLINNRCNYALRLATCVVGSTGRNACDKGGQQEMFPVPPNARSHAILDMQVGSNTKYFILACKDPWTPGDPHMDGGKFAAEECAW